MQQGDAAWLDTRSKCAVTASELANALGVGYSSRIAYMKRKLGLAPKEETNWMMEEGTRMEPWVAELYFRLMHACYHPVQLYTDSFRHLPQDHRIGGSVDRIVRDPATGEEWVLEIKTCHGQYVRDKPPVGHVLQMALLCQLYGVNKAHYICWSCDLGIFVCELIFDPHLWSDVIWPRVKEFADLWGERRLPERMNAADKRALLQAIERLYVCREIKAIRQVREEHQK